MSNFRLNRTTFKGQTAKEASNHSAYYQKLDWKERLRIAHYLNSIAFNFPLDNPPKMDKKVYSVKSGN